MTNNIKDANEWRTVRKSPDYSNDWEHTLAGQLIGTNWNFPDLGNDTIQKIRQTHERQAGSKIEYVELVLKYSGRRLPVSGFLRRIDPGDIGDVEPAGPVADRVVEIHRQHSWRKVHTGSGQ
jgi:hypothetical protein